MKGGLKPPGRADIGNNPAVAVFISEIRGVEPTRLMETQPNTKRGCFVWLGNDGWVQPGYVKVQRVHIM